MSGPSLSPERRRQIEEVFEAALDRPPDERPAFLRTACGGDLVLHAEVAALLDAHDLPGGILERDPRRMVAGEPTALAPGQKVDAYEVVREIGRGGMAAVYLAEDERHGRRLALKVLHPGLGAFFGHERFRREIRLAARLHHPHILPLHDSGESQGQLWYTMPYVDGESLRDRLRREGRLPVAEAVRIARQVADALDYAHREGVIHRDVKPENLLLTRDGEVLVADFGIGRVFDASSPEATLTRSGMLIGTPAYMSPEQALGTQKLDGRTDVYSLGCVLYEMLTGAPPFAGATAQRVIAGHINEPVPAVRKIRAEVPPALDLALRRALAKTPRERFERAGLLGEALGGRESHGGDKRRTIAAALLALLAAGAVYYFLSRPDDPPPAPSPRSEAAPTAATPASATALRELDWAMDRDAALRDHLARVLAWQDAHGTFEAAVQNLPASHRGRVPDGLPYSPWQLLEHLRITQHDILDFCRNPDYTELHWPDDYWPGSAAPPSDTAWDESVRSFLEDRTAMQALASDRSTDLLATIPHGDGQTYLREILLAADHTSYHVGQLIAVRRLLGIWS